MLATWYGPNIQAAGVIPLMLLPDDPRPAREQLDEGYAHGGGWRKFEGFTLTGDSTSNFRLTYPDDPPYKPQAWTLLRGELVMVFPHSWVCIVQPDGKYEVARMD